jgi:hypothetical protein
MRIALVFYTGNFFCFPSPKRKTTTSHQLAGKILPFRGSFGQLFCCCNSQPFVRFALPSNRAFLAYNIFHVFPARNEASRAPGQKSSGPGLSRRNSTGGGPRKHVALRFFALVRYSARPGIFIATSCLWNLRMVLRTQFRPEKPCELASLLSYAQNACNLHQPTYSHLHPGSAESLTPPFRRRRLDDSD